MMFGFEVAILGNIRILELCEMIQNIIKFISIKKRQRVKKYSGAEMEKALKIAVYKAETQANIRVNLEGL